MLTLAELLAIENDPSGEMAYRRGVHQALCAVADFLRGEGYEAAAAICDTAGDIAGVYRFDAQQHPTLMADLTAELRRRVV